MADAAAAGQAVADGDLQAPSSVMSFQIPAGTRVPSPLQGRSEPESWQLRGPPLVRISVRAVTDVGRSKKALTIPVEDWKASGRGPGG